MSTRKEKADKKKAERQKAVIQPKGPAVNATPELNAPAQIEPLRRTTLNKIEPVQGKATVNNGPRGSVIPDVVPVQGKAVAMNQEQASVPVNPATKPLTLSDMLAPLRNSIVKEKTDAAKMQQYYALADAFSALGKMGGAAIGGAIGGNALDSAPNVGEYKESRGYLDAFERAKQANDRLRALDEKAFSLALRDEERSYRQQEAKLDREYRRQMAILENDLRAAQAKKNAELELEVKTKIENLTHQHDMDLANLRGQQAIEEKKLSKEIVDSQMAGRNGGNSSNGGVIGKDIIPVRFSNREVVNIPAGYYDLIANSLIDRDINGVYVDKTNVNRVIEDNPDLIKEYLVDYGLMEAPAVEPVSAKNEASEESVPKKKTLKERAAEYGKLAGTIVPGTYNGLNQKNSSTDTADNEQDNKEKDSKIQIDW